MVSLVFILEMYYTEKEETAGKVTRFLISVLERVTNNPRNNKVVGETELHKGKGKSEEADELPEDLTQSCKTVDRMPKLASMLDKACCLFFSVVFILETVIFMFILRSS